MLTFLIRSPVACLCAAARRPGAGEVETCPCSRLRLVAASGCADTPLEGALPLASLVDLASAIQR